MIDINRGLAEAVMGVLEYIFEDIKGKPKEVIGTFTGRSDLVREGRAQQDKAKGRRDAARKEAEAEKARAKAKAQEPRQRAEQ